MSRLIAVRTGRPGLLLALLASAAPAFAQDEPPPPAEPPAETPPATAGEPPAPQAARSYTPADFARFNPRNALDMLNQVPGFSIEASDTGRRGLGQATGNVLVNGERIVIKSTDIFSELRQISITNVTRIEIVDGATLNVSGLTGQVANIITANQGLTGNFVYRPQIRARRTPARLTNGEISINGMVGQTQIGLSLRNDAFRNGNAGRELVVTPAGDIIDVRDEVLTVGGDQPRISTTLRRNFGDGSALNLNGAFQLYHFGADEISLRSGPGQPDRDRRFREQEREYNYEIGGDYEFPIGGGRMKLIGLRQFEHSPYRQELRIDFSDATPDFGQRFTQVADETETIFRAEYRWRGGSADWQVSLEGALNVLEIENALFDMDPNGDFIQVPLPNSAATVEEQRVEAMLTYGRPLSSTLTLQASLGGEYSQLTQTGAGGISRTFYRPKGFLNLAWRPRQGFDVSARIERVVGQLNFFDFVASANISGGTQNAGNINLVPPQSWNAQIQATRNLGPWGTATARLYGRLIQDIVDIVPIGTNGQSPGNLDGNASVYGIQLTNTFNLDPIGWRGAKVDVNLQLQRTRLTDPLTGRRRPINENLTREISINLRYDQPGTQWAYGANFYQFRQSAGFRLDQRFQYLDTPGGLGLFIEHKDVFGLTVRASVDNLLGTNESFSRTFFNGFRDATNSNILFTEDRDRFYGPIFSFTISGTI